MSSANGGRSLPTATTTIRTVRYYVDMDDPNTPERHINIHFSPDIMAGVYANFANVSHSDYEFRITFRRVDHEVEGDEVPGVVVARINLSPTYMRRLIDVMHGKDSIWVVL